MSTQERADEILERLGETGRRTASRQAIVEALVAIGTHVTADELTRRVKRRFPAVNASTIYRTLDRLEELGIVDHVHLGHGRAIFHLKSDDHQHLVCERCERVEEVSLAELRPFIRMLDKSYGFEVDRRHFAIVGLCRKCRGRD